MDALLPGVARLNEALESMDQRMGSPSTASTQAASAVKGPAASKMATASTAVETAATQFGNEEALATQPVRDMVAASVQQVAAEQTVAAAAAVANCQLEQRVAAPASVASAVQRQNAVTAKTSHAVAGEVAAEQKAAAATGDHREALPQLPAATNPLLLRLSGWTGNCSSCRAAVRRRCPVRRIQKFDSEIDALRRTLDGIGVSASQTREAMRQLRAQITDVTSCAPNSS